MVVSSTSINCKNTIEINSGVIQRIVSEFEKIFFTNNATVNSVQGYAIADHNAVCTLDIGDRI
ncbi:hypothetical protein M0G74_16565 [Microbulbifer sp. CAU 1566]|uniref:hypothetical protein n=1 Tax=Microbulbifer sp. CAU 1566 TaxID=2933269 RepID=UPI0020045448|nr:hypothetical protein [Microbulbifer sp. CAU 1566]MCK7598890.1 hypothetical protein [Microbulbifer sp. CAU 1566]